MTKYQPLEAYLARSPAAETAMSFAEIEAVLGAPLPHTALTHRAWWSNNPSNNVMTRSWLAAGYRTERVDMVARTLVFRRADAVSPGPRRGVAAPPPTSSLLERLWRSLAGTVRAPDHVDLVDPVGDAWNPNL
jgi:hypothetical protein